MAERFLAQGDHINDHGVINSDSWHAPTDLINASPITIVTPFAMFDDEPNLVLSLCTDGMHRPAVDIDFPCEITEAFGRKLLHVDITPPSRRYRFGLYSAKRHPDDHHYIRTFDVSQWGELELVPSSTEGHFHLYGDHAFTWVEYSALLNAMVGAGIVGRGYNTASQERGFTALRRPGFPKPARAAEETVNPWWSHELIAELV
jgi:hypothetical protein